jgi:hypothetical protein
MQPSDEKVVPPADERQGVVVGGGGRHVE